MSNVECMNVFLNVVFGTLFFLFAALQGYAAKVSPHTYADEFVRHTFFFLGHNQHNDVFKISI